MESEIFPPIPPDTSKVASAVFGRSNFYIAVGNQANWLFDGSVPNDSTIGGNRKKAMLYLITIFQIVETLPDQFAAEAVRNRVDWKYALHLPLNYSGQDPSTLCEFRKWLRSAPAREQKLEQLISKVNQVMDASGSKFFSLDTNKALVYICLTSRVMEVYETVSQVLETLATRRPELLRSLSLPHWYKRYSHHQKDLIPTMERAQLLPLANAIGMDVYHLLKSISTSELDSLSGLAEIAALKQIWHEQYTYSQGEYTWKNNDCEQCSGSFSTAKFS